MAKTDLLRPLAGSKTTPWPLAMGINHARRLSGMGMSHRVAVLAILASMRMNPEARSTARQSKRPNSEVRRPQKAPMAKRAIGSSGQWSNRLWRSSGLKISVSVGALRPRSISVISSTTSRFGYFGRRAKCSRHPINRSKLLRVRVVRGSPLFFSETEGSRGPIHAAFDINNQPTFKTPNKRWWRRRELKPGWAIRESAKKCDKKPVFIG